MESSRLFGCVFAGILIAAFCAPVVAQRANQPQSRYEGLQLLLVARYLGLTQEQLPQVIALSQEAAKAKADRKARLDAAHKEGRASLTAVVDALVAAKPAGAEVREKADQIIEEYRLASDACDEAVIGLTSRFVEMLTDEQRRLIETEEQTRRREAASVGTSMIPPEDYIAGEFEIVRTLRRDEYDIVRVLLARDMAQTIVTALDLDPDETVPLAEHMLGVMDDVMSWSNARFADQAAHLPQLIAEEFDLPEPPQPIPPRLTLAQIDTFLSHDSTVALLQRFEFAEQQASPPVLYALADPDLFIPAARLKEDADRRHPIEKLLDSTDLLAALNDLDVSAEQLAVIDGSIRLLHADYDTQRKLWQAILVRYGDVLGAATTVLLKGGSLTEQQSDALMEIHAVEGETAFRILNSAAERLRQIRGALDGDQNMLIDWRAPLAAVYGERAEDKIDRLLMLAGGVADFVDLFGEVRYIDPITYQANAEGIAREFIERHTEARGRRLEASVRRLLEIINEVRAYPERQWSETAAGLLAVDAMIEFRLLPEDAAIRNGPAGGDDATYTWWDMERMASDPLIPELSRRIQEAEAAAPQ